MTALLFLVAGVWRGVDGAPELHTLVRRGPLTARLTVTGTLKPIQVMTYRSPLVGREAELIALVAEGTMVKEGDLVARLDTSALAVELERARQDARQAEADLQLADVDREEAEASAAAAVEGEGALTVEEAQARLHAAERRAERLREEHAQLEPLLKRGFITREELRKTADALDAADEELALIRRRMQVLVGVTRPRELQRTRLQRAQKAAQVEQARTRVAEARVRAQALEALVESCSIYARRPGLVIHEELLTANPRRKVRVGDRVTASQGLLTIPEVDRMLLETSVSESEVRRVRPGQRAAIRVEAFPALQFHGTVTRVGTLARPAPDRPFDDKRFDLHIELEARESGAASGDERTRRRHRGPSPRGAAGAGHVHLRHRARARRLRLAARERRGAADRDRRVGRHLGRGDVGRGRGRIADARRAWLQFRAPDGGPAGPERRSPGLPMRAASTEFAEAVRSGVAALLRYKLRTTLSVLGVVLGVAGVVAMVSVGEGARRQTLAQVQALGLDNIVARSRATPHPDSIDPACAWRMPPGSASSFPRSLWPRR